MFPIMAGSRFPIQQHMGKQWFMIVNSVLAWCVCVCVYAQMKHRFNYEQSGN